MCGRRRGGRSPLTAQALTADLRPDIALVSSARIPCYERDYWACFHHQPLTPTRHLYRCMLLKIPSNPPSFHFNIKVKCSFDDTVKKC